MSQRASTAAAQQQAGTERQVWREGLAARFLLLLSYIRQIDTSLELITHIT